MGLLLAPSHTTHTHTHTHTNVQFINNRNTNGSNRTELSLDLKAYPQTFVEDSHFQVQLLQFAGEGKKEGPGRDFLL